MSCPPSQASIERDESAYHSIHHPPSRDTPQALSSPVDRAPQPGEPALSSECAKDRRKGRESFDPRAHPWPGTTTGDTGGVTTATRSSAAWSCVSPSPRSRFMTRVNAPVVSAARPAPIARRTGASADSFPAPASTSSHELATGQRSNERPCLLPCCLAYERRLSPWRWWNGEVILGL